MEEAEIEGMRPEGDESRVELAERDGAEDGPLNWAPIVLEKLHDAVEDRQAQGEAGVSHRYVHCDANVRVGEQRRCSSTAMSISSRIGLRGLLLPDPIHSRIRVGFKARIWRFLLLRVPKVRVSGPTGSFPGPVEMFPGSIGGVRHVFTDEDNDDDESAMFEVFWGTLTCDLCMCNCM